MDHLLPGAPNSPAKDPEPSDALFELDRLRVTEGQGGLEVHDRVSARVQGGRLFGGEPVGSAAPLVSPARRRREAILIYGPPQMIENLTKQFREAGVPRDRLFFEDFGFLGSATRSDDH